MKRIESIALQNFRGIRDGKVEGLVDVNVIVGRNNSGKSTVVEALMRCAHAAKPTHGDAAGRVRDGLAGRQRGENGNLDSSCYYRNAASAEITVQSNEGLVLLRLVGPNAGTTASGNVSSLGGASCFYPSDARNPEIERALWPDTLRNRRDKMLANSLSEIFGMDVEGVQLPPDGRAVLLFTEYGLPLDAQGDGARAAFRALTLLGAMKDAPLILEEPECHQHPGSLQRFALAVVNLAKTNGVQLFITTHSGECVAAFLNAAGSAKSEAAVFHFALNDGAFEARKLDAQTVDTLTATGTDVRFLSLYA